MEIWLYKKYFKITNTRIKNLRILLRSNAVYFNNHDNPSDPYWRFVYDNDKHYSAATGGDGNIYIYQKLLLNVDLFGQVTKIV